MMRFRVTKKLIVHQMNGDYIVYYDERELQPVLYARTRPCSESLPSCCQAAHLNVKNLQVQCAVSVEDGLMLHQLQRGSMLIRPLS